MRDRERQERDRAARRAGDDELRRLTRHVGAPRVSESPIAVTEPIGSDRESH